MAEMTSVVHESGPSILTKEMTSEYDSGMDIHLSGEESENADYLIEIVVGTSEVSTSFMTETPETEDADILDFLEDLHLTSAGSHPLHSSPEAFIEQFSKINVIRNDTAAGLREEKFGELAGTLVATGNSRDLPSRFIFYCPNEVWGCDQHSSSSKRMRSTRENARSPWIIL
jgi:hypothetical protein